MNKLYKFLLVSCLIFLTAIFILYKNIGSFDDATPLMIAFIFNPIYLIILIATTVIFIKRIKKKEKIYVLEVVTITIFWIMTFVPLPYPMLPLLLSFIFKSLLYILGIH